MAMPLFFKSMSLSGLQLNENAPVSRKRDESDTTSSLSALRRDRAAAAAAIRRNFPETWVWAEPEIRFGSRGICLEFMDDERRESGGLVMDGGAGGETKGRGIGANKIAIHLRHMAQNMPGSGGEDC